MKTTYITRRETFNAAHKLWRPEWSDEKNWEVFGKCANHNWHGHNFELWVTVKGIPDPDTGFIMNLKLLSQIVKEHIIEALDQKPQLRRSVFGRSNGIYRNHGYCHLGHPRSART
jgi:6-pyruvoyltetrahydropterin/6-carboxytetrahydropterin synthase